MSNLFRPIMKDEQKYNQFTNTNSYLLENNTKVLGNDDADVNNQKSRTYKEENIMSYLKRFSSLVALMPTLRAGFSLLIIKRLQETKLSPIVVCVCDSKCFLK